MQSPPAVLGKTWRAGWPRPALSITLSTGTGQQLAMASSRALNGQDSATLPSGKNSMRFPCVAGHVPALHLWNSGLVT